MQNKVDIIIDNAQIIDGTGAPSFQGGIAILGNRIEAIGDINQFDASHKINVRGNVVAPGFIDCHTHDDRVLLDDPQMAFKVTQGVTTVIAGNCGISLAPFNSNNDWEMPVPMSLLGNKKDYKFPLF